MVVLAGTFLIRVPYYQEQAEKAAMQQVEGALQSALVLRYGALMARGAATEKELSILATDNPMTWLQQKPRNYAGEYYDPTPGAVAPGNWMFDLKSRDLIYVVDHGDYFTPGQGWKEVDTLSHPFPVRTGAGRRCASRRQERTGRHVARAD